MESNGEMSPEMATAFREVEPGACCPFKSRVTPSGIVSVWVMVAGCHSLTVPPPLWAACKASSKVLYLVEEPP